MALLNEKVLAGNFSSSTCTFWPFWAKTYRLGVVYPGPVHFSHFVRKCTGWGLYILRLFILAIWCKNVPVGSFWFSGVTLCHSARKYVGRRRFTLNWYSLANLGENVPAGGFIFSACIFWPFGAKMYLLAVFYSQGVHFGHCGRKCTSWVFRLVDRYILLLSEEIQQLGMYSSQPVHFWTLWATMHQPGGFYFSPLHFGNFGPKCTSWEFCILREYILAVHSKHVPLRSFLFSNSTFRSFQLKKGPGVAFLYSASTFSRHFARKCTSWVPFILFRYICANLRENMAAGGVLLSAGTFWPVWAKMYRLGVFRSQPGHFWQFGAKTYRLGIFYSKRVNFGHLRQKCICWELFILNWYILAISDENVLDGGCLFSAGRIWPFWAKMYCLGVFMPMRYILAILGENVPAGGFLFRAGTFWPFRAKMYRLGVFYAQPVVFGHFCAKTC